MKSLLVTQVVVPGREYSPVLHVETLDSALEVHFMPPGHVKASLWDVPVTVLAGALGLATPSAQTLPASHSLHTLGVGDSSRY